MKPILYNKILKAIDRHHITTITLDIFDTIILNDYWPSDLRHYDLAIKQLPLIHDSINQKVTAYELFDLRRYAKRLLRSCGIALRLDTWLTKLVELLLIKYPAKLTDDQKLGLIASLIKLELEFTLENCKPNQPLLAQLQQLKQSHPDLSFYFLSHSYFTSTQIKILLQILQIELFDNGVSAADIDDNQNPEKLYSLLSKNFQTSQNLHLGDNYQQDFLESKSIGCHAVHYRPIRMRGLRTLVGASWIRLLELHAHYRAYIKSTSDTWVEYGQILTQREKVYSHQISAITNLNSNNYIIAASLSPYNLTNSSNVKISPQLDKATTIHAFIWLLATFNSPRWDAAKLLQLLLNYTNIKTRTALYDFCFAPNYIYSNLAIQSFTEHDFYQAFLNEIKNAAPEFTTTLHNAYETAILALPQNDKPVTFIAMLDDGNAELFYEFMRLHNFINPFEKIILNPHNTPIPDLSSYQESQVDLGRRLVEKIDNFHYEIAPDIYLNNILQSKLNKILKTH